MLLCTLSVVFPVGSSVISYLFYAMSYGLFAISYVSIVSPIVSSAKCVQFWWTLVSPVGESKDQKGKTAIT